MAAESIQEGLTRPLLDDTNFGTTEDIESCNKIEEARSSSIPQLLVFSTFVAVCGSFCYGFSVGYSSPAESGILEDLKLSVASYSVFGSIMTIGGMIGAILSGNIADRIGRKYAMLLSQVFCTPGWFAIAFSEDVWLLDIGRLLLGFGVGLITYVVPVYIAETTPKDFRGRFASAHQLMIAFGFGLAYLMGNIISWRTLSLVAVIPCLLQIMGLYFIPESPRWLAKVGKEKEFKAALQRFRGKQADISTEAMDIKDIIETFQQNTSEAVQLFDRRYTYPIIVSVGLMFLQQLGGNSGISYYVSTIFKESGFSPAFGTTSIAILEIPVALLSLLLMDICGRKSLLMVSSAGTSLCLLFVGVSFYFQDLNYLAQLTPTFVYIGIPGYVAFFTVGLSGIPWIIMSEIFPINAKASAGSIVTLTNWSTSWLVTYMFNFMMQWSRSGTFFFFGTVSALTIVFVWKFVPETKGLTLEEIQEKITLQFQ